MDLNKLAEDFVKGIVDKLFLRLESTTTNRFVHWAEMRANAVADEAIVNYGPEILAYIRANIPFLTKVAAQAQTADTPG